MTETTPEADVQDDESRMDWLALSRALSGALDPAALNEPTRQAFDEHVEASDGETEPAEPTEAEQRAAEFWAQVREAEAAIGAKEQELGPGPEFDAWIDQLAQLRP